ncbi:hypothetical protein HZH66_013635 [Vespula vulgaris]|uniref:Uncharacterized protein n=1 Tax=Vespula vulgaris TaxID=7454 RepID=A0A834MTC4_VESVU|nr:hypothetical protein HZH66_013635 [Vespula vulgaris]
METRSSGTSGYRSYHDPTEYNDYTTKGHVSSRFVTIRRALRIHRLGFTRSAEGESGDPIAKGAKLPTGQAGTQRCCRATTRSIQLGEAKPSVERADTGFHAINITVHQQLLQYMYMENWFSVDIIFQSYQNEEEEEEEEEEKEKVEEETEEEEEEEKEKVEEEKEEEEEEEKEEGEKEEEEEEEKEEKEEEEEEEEEKEEEEKEEEEKEKEGERKKWRHSLDPDLIGPRVGCILLLSGCRRHSAVLRSRTVSYVRIREREEEEEEEGGGGGGGGGGG